MFSPSLDLTAIQNIVKADADVLSLLNLSGKPVDVVLKRIIRESRWTDLASDERRLCFYFLPSRKTRNESFNKEVIEFDCHLPIGEGDYAYQIQEQLYRLFHKQKINNRYMYFESQLGELPTMPGFFCCGSRFVFNRII